MSADARDIMVGTGVHVREQGTGAPVLFLHGNPDTCALWDGVVAHMAGRYRCLAADLPGFGQSGMPRDFDCSLDGWSAWVQALTLALGLTEPIHLVVHDFGGLFGIAWAVQHPERLRRLAILNTMFFPDYRWHVLARIFRTPLLGELIQASSTRWGVVGEMRRGSRGLPEAYARQAYDAMTPLMKRTVLRLYRAADPEQFVAWQPGLEALMARVPTLVLWGDRDPYINKRFAERFHASQVHHFPDHGHWLPVEDPDAVAARLLAFFA